jgi:hypothetical protein
MNLGIPDESKLSAVGISAARCRACVAHVTAELDVSERFACKVLGQHRSTQRKASEAADDEAALTGAIIDCARQ